VTVIDGSTNSTMTFGLLRYPVGVAVDPVTRSVLFTNHNADTLTMLAGGYYDTRVRLSFNPLPGDSTSLARPVLTGDARCGLTPNRGPMLGAYTQSGTMRHAWDTAATTSGAGTDSITWTMVWGDDSLVLGQNLLCFAPFDAGAATTNNAGLGTPWTGNSRAYAVYRIIQPYPGVADNDAVGRVGDPGLSAAPNPFTGRTHVSYNALGGGVVHLGLYDVSGRLVRDLTPTRQVTGRAVLDVDASAMAPGVYVLKLTAGRLSTSTKLVVY
jgi:hypothetical protein